MVPAGISIVAISGAGTEALTASASDVLSPSHCWSRPACHSAFTLARTKRLILVAQIAVKVVTVVFRVCG